MALLTNPYMKLIINSNVLKIINEKDENFLDIAFEGISLPYDEEQDYGLFYSGVNKTRSCEIFLDAYALNHSFVVKLLLKNTSHKPLAFKTSINGNYAVDELRESFSLNDYRLSIFDGEKFYTDALFFKVEPLKSKHFYFVFAHRDEIDKLSDVVFSKDFVMLDEYHDKMYLSTLNDFMHYFNVQTDNAHYNTLFNYSKVIISSYFKIKDETIILQNKELFDVLFSILLLSSLEDTEISLNTLRHISTANKQDLKKNPSLMFLFLNALKHYVSVSGNVDFANELFEEGYGLRIKYALTPWNIINEYLYSHKQEHRLKVWDIISNESFLSAYPLHAYVILKFFLDGFSRGMKEFAIRKLLSLNTSYRDFINALELKDYDFLNRYLQQQPKLFEAVVVYFVLSRYYFNFDVKDYANNVVIDVKDDFNESKIEYKNVRYGGLVFDVFYDSRSKTLKIYYDESIVIKPYEFEVKGSVENVYVNDQRVSKTEEEYVFVVRG